MPSELINDRALRFSHRIYVTLVLIFLIAPLIVIIPLSFNAQPYFTFSPEMLRLEPEAWSLRWYEVIWNDEQWTRALANSTVIAVISTLLATVLGTVAALGIASQQVKPLLRSWLMGVVISPMIMPIIITATGVFFFYSSLGLSQTYTGIIIAHTVLGTPFVVITVVATLSGFDYTLMRAAASLGGKAVPNFFRIQLPLIAPGVVSGALFAFTSSFDELVVVLFMGGLDQRTIPRQMWSGIREQISPAILSVATLLIIFTLLLMLVVEWLRRRGAAQPG